jgi:hypothetical protein
MLVCPFVWECRRQTLKQQSFHTRSAFMGNRTYHNRPSLHTDHYPRGSLEQLLVVLNFDFAETAESWMIPIQGMSAGFG